MAVLCHSCVSENEQSGLDAIAANYDGKASFSKGFHSAAGQETVNTFNIKLTESQILDTLRQDFASLNIAMMMYDSFTPEEKGKYDRLMVEIVNSKTEESSKYEFDPEKIKPCIDQSAIFKFFSDNILNKDYGTIAKNVQPKYQTQTLGIELGNFMNTIIDVHGNAVQYRSTVSSIITMPDGDKFYRYDGFFTFSDGYRRPYFITASTDVENNYIAGYQLDL